MNLVRTGFLTMLLLACGPETHGESIDQDCSSQCNLAVTCNGTGSDDDAKIQRCEDECVGWYQGTLDQGGSCTSRYEALIACVGVLSCSEFDAYIHRVDEADCVSDYEDFERLCKFERE